MRTITTQGYTITYPDPIVWLYDLNKIHIAGTTAGFNTKIQIQNPDGETSFLEYTTRTKTIMYVLDDNIRWLWTKGNGDWSISIYVDEVLIHSFSFKVLNGNFYNTHMSRKLLALHYTTRV